MFDLNCTGTPALHRSRAGVCIERSFKDSLSADKRPHEFLLTLLKRACRTRHVLHTNLRKCDSAQHHRRSQHYMCLFPCAHLSSGSITILTCAASMQPFQCSISVVSFIRQWGCSRYGKIFENMFVMRLLEVVASWYITYFERPKRYKSRYRIEIWKIK